MFGSGGLTKRPIFLADVACRFAQYPLGGLGTLRSLQILHSIDPEMPNCLAACMIGFDQTRSYSSCRVKSTDILNSLPYCWEVQYKNNEFALLANQRRQRYKIAGTILPF